MRATAFHQSTHLTDQQLHAPHSSCPFCGSRSRTPVWILQESPDVALLRCDDCHACSASRMPTDEALDGFYRQYYAEGSENVTFDHPARLSAHIAKRVTAGRSSIRGQELVIIDFGGGDGTISVGVAELLIANGASKVEILLIDHCHAMAEPGRSNIVVRMCEFDEVRSQSADVVLASAILEHLSKPREIMERLFDALKIEGIFYARTPYVLPLARLAAKLGHKVDFTFPGHLHDMGRDFWDGVGAYFPVKLETIASTTSIVESTFDKHFLRAFVARLIKLPSRIFRNQYNLVGGWEVFLRRAG